MELITPPIPADWGMIVARFDGWEVRVIEMLFNNRVVLFPTSGPAACPAYAWCYPKGMNAFAAVATWNPETQGEPTGYKKRVLSISRQPGETAEDYLSAFL